MNGAVASLGATISEADEIALDGVVLQLEGYVYILLNKPKGTITTASDPQGRPTVVELVERQERLFPVGRLDADTTGVILLTNDGALAHSLSHPRFGVEKTYLAKVKGTPSPAALEQLRKGVVLDDGLTSPARVHISRSVGRGSVVELVIHEGRKHQVKRMLAAVGHPVVALDRSCYATLTVGQLGPGEWRELTVEEVGRLRRASAPEA